MKAEFFVDIPSFTQCLKKEIHAWPQKWIFVLEEEEFVLQKIKLIFPSYRAQYPHHEHAAL